MSTILKFYKMDDMKETVRADLLNCMEHLDEVQQWREKQDDPASLNNPSTVWRAFQKSGKQQDKRDQDRKPSAQAQVKAENVRLQQENERITEELKQERSAREFERTAAADPELADRLARLIKLRRFPLTAKQFNLILMVCHPDRQTDPQKKAMCTEATRLLLSVKMLLVDPLDHEEEDRRDDDDSDAQGVTLQ
jgi:hypothetical protein